jgi:hypothetical protein
MISEVQTAGKATGSMRIRHSSACCNGYECSVNCSDRRDRSHVAGDVSTTTAVCGASRVTNDFDFSTGMRLVLKVSLLMTLTCLNDMCD